MKKLLLVVVLALGLGANAQRKQTDLFKKSFGNVEVSQTKYEEAGREDMVVTRLMFQNQSYQYSTDSQLISVHTADGLDLLISNLQGALDFSKSREKSEITFEDKKHKYSITADGKNGRITLYSTGGGGGYIYVHPKNISKIIDALKELKK
jgi:lipopolysaccharide export LptBFGC system permease protein LptF